MRRMLGAESYKKLYKDSDMKKREDENGLTNNAHDVYDSGEKRYRHFTKSCCKSRILLSSK